MSINQHKPGSTAWIIAKEAAQREEAQREEERLDKKQAAIRKQDRQHDWAVNIVSALIGAVVGGIAGYLASLATLWLAK